MAALSKQRSGTLENNVAGVLAFAQIACASGVEDTPSACRLRLEVILRIGTVFC